MAGESAVQGGAFHQRLRKELRIGGDAGESEAVQHAAEVVRAYCAGGFTGAAFDTYGHNDPGRITADDLIAVTMLSIHIREQSTSSLRPSSILTLDSMTSRINDLLSLIPADRELHTITPDEFDRWLGPKSPGDELYWLLRKGASIPRVAVYKLLARKRLALLPIRDTVVEKALGQKADPWWLPWWQTLAADPEVVSRLSEIRKRADAEHLSLLRVVDIAVWMNHQPTGDTDGAQ